MHLIKKWGPDGTLAYGKWETGKRQFSADPLTRAVVISLFTHRRADPDDNVDVPMGWWGDTWPVVANDRYGSKLWILQRSKLTNTSGEYRAQLSA